LGCWPAKFARDAEELARTALFPGEIGEMVRPTRRLRVFEGADNRILECAVAGHTVVLVTGDRLMLDQEKFESVAIISLRAYLKS
jgi:predicted nucleic acid-binding protein